MKGKIILIQLFECPYKKSVLGDQYQNGKWFKKWKIVLFYKKKDITKNKNWKETFKKLDFPFFYSQKNSKKI